MIMRVGFFKDFLGSDTILVDGDVAALQAFADVLRRLELPGALAVKIHRLPFVCACHGIELNAQPVGRELGIRRTKKNLPCFSWHHSEEGWLEAAEKIEKVARSGGGHNWLECIGVEDAHVLVCADEYGEDWWQRHASP